MPMDIRPKRTNTSGATPSSLSSGEIYVNMADRRAFIHNGTSAVQIAGGKLTALGDVSVSSLATNQKLLWNGSSWVNVNDRQFPDYTSPTALTIGAGPVQATSDGFVTVAAWGAYRNGLEIRVGPTSSTPYTICMMGDDLNAYTKASSFSFPIKKNSWFNLISGNAITGDGFEYYTAYFWPAA